MTFKKLLFTLALLGSLVACGKPVPPDKIAYVGEWQEPSMYLLITKEGSVTYKRKKGDATTSIDGPLKDFDGNNFEVGVGPAATKFIVSKPPYQVGDQWKMVVDDVELTRSGP